MIKEGFPAVLGHFMFGNNKCCKLEMIFGLMVQKTGHFPKRFSRHKKVVCLHLVQQHNTAGIIRFALKIRTFNGQINTLDDQDRTQTES